MFIFVLFNDTIAISADAKNALTTTNIKINIKLLPGLPSIYLFSLNLKYSGIILSYKSLFFQIRIFNATD
ncbi:hypothetical protein GCM10008914_26940 [Clostridium tertium]